MSDMFGRGEPRTGDVSKSDAAALEEALTPLLERAKGSTWYDAPGAPVDVATARLCLLRRAYAAVGATTEAGDVAVRRVLDGADHDAVVWLLSRAISYMDEQGFPDFVPEARLEE